MAGYIYITGRIHEEVRRTVERHLAEKFPHLDVSVDAARIAEGEGIRVTGVSLRLKDVSGPGGEIAYVDELNLICDVRWTQLLQGPPQLQHFVLHRPRIRVVRLRDGSWNFEQLLRIQSHCSADDLTHGRIENATVQVVDMLKSPPSAYTLRDLNLTVRRRDDPQPRGIKNQASASPIVELQGHTLGDHLRRATVQGAVDLDRDSWTLSLQVDDLDISPELHAALPAAVCQQLGQLTLRARSHVAFSLAYDPARENPWKFQSSIAIADGRIDDPRLPYPLSELKAELQISDTGLVVSQLSARYRQTTLQGRGSRAGWDAQAPCELELSGRHVLLDPKLAKTFPDLAPVWNAFLPSGEFDIDARLSFDGAAWHPWIKITSLGCSFAYDDYPYRLERATGAIEIAGLDWSFNLTAYSKANPIALRGSLHDFGDAAVGWIEISGPQVRIEQEMIDALPEEPRELVAALQPAGQMSVYARYWRETPESKLRQHLRLGLQRMSFCHLSFPYRVENVQGVVEITDDRCDVRNLVGSNDTGVVSAHGELIRTPRGREFTLHLQGDQIPLDEELRDALPRSAQRVWHELRPQGAAHARATLYLPPGDDQVQCRVRLEPAGETVSMEPQCFPLRLEKLAGAIVFDNGELTIESLRAEHGNTMFFTRGGWQSTANGGGQLILRDFRADRLHVDRDLLKVLPEGLRQALSEVNPTGAINVDGVLGFSRGPLMEDPLEADWDLNLYFHGNSIQPGIRLENIFGSVRLNGGVHRNGLRCQGTLELDNVDYHGLQFTDVRGPLWWHDAGLWLGSPASPEINPQKYQHVTAKAYGGTLLVDGWVAPQAEQLRYSLRAALRDADLMQFSQDAVSGSSNFTGKADARLQLTGTSEGVRSLRGGGDLQLREADIYKLPQMVSLLKVLRLKPPSNSAFTQCDVNFHLEGDYVYLDRILFNGDAVSLEGQGEVNFNRDVRLAFRATVVQGDRWLPVVREMIKGAAQQIVEIRVDGTLDKPEFHNDPFPGVGKAIKQLQESTRPLPPLSSEAAGRKRNALR